MKSYIRLSIGILIGICLIWLLFRDTDWKEVGKAIKNIHWGWLMLSHIPLLATHFFRVLRWKYIVQTVHPTSFHKLASATQIGLLANFVLPGRAGEAVRAIVLTRLTKIPFSKTFALVALDRITDLFALIMIMLVAIVAFQPVTAVVLPQETFSTPSAISFPPELYRGGAVGMSILLVSVILSFVLLYINKNLVIHIVKAILGIFSGKLAAFVTSHINHFAEGLHVFRSPREMFLSLIYSMCSWGCSILGTYLMLEAFHMDYPWYTPFVIQAVLSVFIAIPGAPGFVGQFHVPIVICLVMVMPTINVNVAKAYAIVAYINQLPSVILLGLYFLIMDGFGIKELLSNEKQNSI